MCVVKKKILKIDIVKLNSSERVLSGVHITALYNIWLYECFYTYINIANSRIHQHNMHTCRKYLDTYPWRFLSLKNLVCN